MESISSIINCTLENTYPLIKYKGIEAIFVAVHQIQLSTFFLVISHIPVNAHALAKPSAQGIAAGANEYLSQERAEKIIA